MLITRIVLGLLPAHSSLWKRLPSLAGLSSRFTHSGPRAFDTSVGMCSSESAPSKHKNQIRDFYCPTRSGTVQEATGQEAPSKLRESDKPEHAPPGGTFRGTMPPERPATLLNASPTRVRRAITCILKPGSTSSRLVIEHYPQPLTPALNRSLTHLP
ncbi:hypothetical protein CPB85DRAFT_867113 [Mucidula mucida]|nr:hypothetical protein CPB85DRAFT_867113 [Mucidula mucida]